MAPKKTTPPSKLPLSKMNSSKPTPKKSQQPAGKNVSTRPKPTTVAKTLPNKKKPLPLVQISLNLRSASAAKPNGRSQPKVEPSSIRKRTLALATSQPAKVPKTEKPVKLAPYDFKGRLQALQEKYVPLQEEFKALKEENMKMKSANEAMMKENDINVAKLQKEIDDLEEKLSIATAEVKRLGDIEKRHIEVVDMRNILKADLENAKQSLIEYENERRIMHNNIQDLKGKIRVFCRIRPALLQEQDQQLCQFTVKDQQMLTITRLILGASRREDEHTFGFDKIFLQGTDQSIIFAELSQLIQSAIDGYNVSIFAYGQTGSGKTYTMAGTKQNKGMIPLTMKFIFDKTRMLAESGWKYEVHASFLEIYNESIRDLLKPNSKLAYNIFFNEGNGITVTNLTEKPAENANELYDLWCLANQNRSVAETRYNVQSSRSHAVTIITLHGVNANTNVKLKSSIHMIDLAGSENATHSTKERMPETKGINRSLSQLTSVILAINNNDIHIPYRDSKLTYLLHNSLGGDAKSLMIINASPFEDCYRETLESFRFAERVKKVRTYARLHQTHV